jgi:hypothetical protein
MKKIIFPILVALCAFAFVLTGCSKKQGVIEVPVFKSEKVNAYLKDYAAYCESAPRMTVEQFSQIPAKMDEFRKRQAGVVTELQGEAEINAFNKCIQDIRVHLEKVRFEQQKASAAAASQAK